MMSIRTLSAHSFHRKFQNLRACLLGLRDAWPEIAFRQEVLLSLVLSPIPWLVHTTFTEKLLMYGAVFLVLICEILNTAIESLVNVLQPQFDPTAGKAKDLGSAAVALADITFLLCWLGILLH